MNLMADKILKLTETEQKVRKKSHNCEHHCEAMAKRTGEQCRECAFMVFQGKYYCGNHYPYSSLPLDLPADQKAINKGE